MLSPMHVYILSRSLYPVPITIKDRLLPTVAAVRLPRCQAFDRVDRVRAFLVSLNPRNLYFTTDRGIFDALILLCMIVGLVHMLHVPAWALTIEWAN